MEEVDSKTNNDMNQEKIEIDEKLIEALITKRDELKKNLEQLLDKIDKDREKKN